MVETIKGPSKADIEGGIFEPPVPAPHIQAASQFNGHSVVEGRPFPGARPDQIVKGLGVVVLGKGPVEIVAYIAGVDPTIGVPQVGSDAPIGAGGVRVPNETRRNLALGPVVRNGKRVR